MCDSGFVLLGDRDFDAGCGFQKMKNAIRGHADFGCDDCFRTIDQGKWRFIRSDSGSGAVGPYNIGELVDLRVRLVTSVWPLA